MRPVNEIEQISPQHPWLITEKPKIVQADRDLTEARALALQAKTCGPARLECRPGRRSRQAGYGQSAGVWEKGDCRQPEGIRLTAWWSIPRLSCLSTPPVDGRQRQDRERQGCGNPDGQPGIGQDGNGFIGLRRRLRWWLARRAGFHRRCERSDGRDQQPETRRRHPDGPGSSPSPCST